jgi:leader peptidase (prepilin peptidase) / N-methyltransferase
MALLVPSWLAVTGVALAASDLRTRQLPNRLVLPSYLAIPRLAALTALTAITGTHPGALIRATLGMAALLTCYALLYAVFPGQLRGGDLKISGPIGFLLAWQSWSALITSTLLLSWDLNTTPSHHSLWPTTSTALSGSWLSRRWVGGWPR